MAGLVAGIGRAWRNPRTEMRARIAGGLTEGTLLSWLFIACALGFVASLPDALRTARGLEIEDPVAGAIAAHLFGYMFVAPLLLYGISALVHLLARPFGARGGFFGARAALFWSLLAAAPVALVLALVGVLAQGAPAPWLAGLRYAGLAVWLWLFAASLAEAEGFAGTGRVAAVLALAFAGLALSLTSVAHGAPFTG